MRPIGPGALETDDEARSRPCQLMSSEPSRSRSAITRGLSPHTVAVSCVIPAARASAASSLARIDPTPRPWWASATAKAISAESPSRTSLAIPTGCGVAVDVADEDVAVAIDPCERRELEVGEAGLRAAEAALARAVAEACEQCGDRFRVPVSQRSDREPVDVA